MMPALELAALGFSVFPIWGITDGVCHCAQPDCASPGKHPPLKWRDAATRDAAQIERMFRRYPLASSIGVATGEPSGVIVIDLDGEKGIRQWDRLCAGRGGHPTTIEAVTGGGGRHLYFQQPEGFDVRNGVGNRNGIDRIGLGPGIDIRSTGGYVLAPPSQHKSGNAYRWARGRAPGQCAALEVPWWLLKDLVRGARHEEREEAQRTRVGETTRYGAAALTRIAGELAQCAPGNRNNALNRATFAVARLVAGGQIAESDGRSALVEAASACGLAKRETRLTIRSAWRAGLRHPFAPVPRSAA